MAQKLGFSYDAAFERNLGWITEADQLTLRGKRVAIAGMGGVGGVHLITLARLGIGAFNIADFDTFSLANFNRQIGANVATIGRPKAEVLAEMALTINPELRIGRFDDGVNLKNLDAFLSGVDLFVDGFDFFVLDIRRKVFARCFELGIPALTAGPIGMGTSLLAFVPGKMTFEEYFRMEGRPENEQYLRFLMGLVPKALHRTYLVDRSRLNLVNKTGPSIGASCQLCAGVVTVMAAKILLGRGDVKPAPWSHHYDAFRGILATTKLRFGLNGPVQRLKLHLFAPKIIAHMAAQAPTHPPFFPNDTIDEILQAARWSPSGDNEQPWSFKKVGPRSVLIHISRRDPSNPYHYRNGEPNVLSAGMLLESVRIAASMHALRVDWRVEDDADPVVLHLQFANDKSILPDRLFAVLGQRSVDRSRFRTRKLVARERCALEASLGDELRVDWYSTATARWRFAGLSAQATRVRLSTPEGFSVHQRIIDWDSNLSPTKIPATALGLNRWTLRIMHWAMQDWACMRRLNHLGGAFMATFEMDYVPILCSGATFAVRFPKGGERKACSIEELLQVGVRLQRFWLTATQLGLSIQPAMAVLIFADHGQNKATFTNDLATLRAAGRLGFEFSRFFQSEARDFLFMGRIGEPIPRDGVSRSVRKSAAEMTYGPPDNEHTASASVSTAS